MSYGSGESRSILIKRLRSELQDVKQACEKYEQLNSQMTTLENNLRYLKEEKDQANDDSQRKCADLMDRIRDSENEIAELKDEFKEGDRAASDAKSAMEKLNSELAVIEGKQNSLVQKTDSLASYLEELASSQSQLKGSCDSLKKEVAEMKANYTAIDKDQMSLEEKLSKMNLNKRNLQNVLLDLENTEKRLLHLKAERELERDQAANHYSKKEANLSDLNQQLKQLEQQELQLTNERKKVLQANTDINNKRMQEESIQAEIRGELNSIDSRLKTLEDEQRTEDLAYSRMGDSLNDEKDRNERQIREAERLKAILFSNEELNARVVLSNAAYEFY